MVLNNHLGSSSVDCRRWGIQFPGDSQALSYWRPMKKVAVNSLCQKKLAVNSLCQVLGIKRAVLASSFTSLMVMDSIWKEVSRVVTIIVKICCENLVHNRPWLNQYKLNQRRPNALLFQRFNDKPTVKYQWFLFSKYRNQSEQRISTQTLTTPECRVCPENIHFIGELEFSKDKKRAYSHLGNNNCSTFVTSWRKKILWKAKHGVVFWGFDAKAIVTWWWSTTLF